MPRIQPNKRSSNAARSIPQPFPDRLENRCQRADPQRRVPRYRDVVARRFVQGQADVAADLAGLPIADPDQSAYKLVSVQIKSQLHAAMTSSRT